jgi:hypothetical protein
MSAATFDVVDEIIRYEAGELEMDEVIALFDHLVQTGMAWELQGSYGRTAEDMINAGLIAPSVVERS